jgi:hypothetical protein
MNSRLALAAALTLCGAPASLAAEDPFSGVWTYDPAQSRGGPGAQVLTITVRGDQETYLSDWTDGKGRRSLLAFVVRYDGVPTPTTTYNIAPDGTITAVPMEVAARKIDATNRVVEHRVDGRVVRVLRRSPAPGGGAIVSELADFDDQGRQTRTSRLVFVATKPASSPGN